MPIIGVVSEGDQVAVYFIFEGTHTVIPFAGISQTGKTVKMSLMTFLRIADGKIIEKRVQIDKHDISSISLNRLVRKSR